MEGSRYEELTDQEHDEDEDVELEDGPSISGSHRENGSRQDQQQQLNKPTV